MVAPLTPLAELLRPQSLEDVVGQDHLTGPKGFLTQTIKSGVPASLIFWGPAGTGKTTLARIYANAFGAVFEQISAVLGSVADIRRVVDAAKRQQTAQRSLLTSEGQCTVLFVDEIHRFNKAQQDAFLPYVENGTLVLVGATTENPSFSLNDALLSRVQVLTLHALDAVALQKILQRAEVQEGPLPLTPEATDQLIAYAHGDGRYLLTMASSLYNAKLKEKFGPEALGKFLQQRAPIFDKSGDGHYNLISALHKSVRGSDPDAALYWLSRMLEGGEDPVYIARRLIRMAVEDIGLASPQALNQCTAALEAYRTLGSPEGELALAQAVTFLAVSPKSNRVYTAFKEARKTAHMTHHKPPPQHILNAPTKLMQNLGYGEGYIYDPDTPEGFSGQNYFPEGVGRPQFYQPTDKGHEKNISTALARFAMLRTRLHKKGN